MLVSVGAAAQTFSVIHTFTDGPDGAYPYAGLVVDRNGNLYGTANQGGNNTEFCNPPGDGCGTVFVLSHLNGSWKLQPLYAFLGGPKDGQGPYGRVAIGTDGSLYGTTIDGGNPNCLSGCGTVFNLKAPAACPTPQCPWTETVLYFFQGNTDGFYPTGDLAFDPAGNIYGTTVQGGSVGPGTVYELKPANGSWSENIVYNFTGQNDGGNPYSGVILDAAGNIYSTTLSGGINEGGATLELTRDGSAWNETTLHDFYPSTEGIFAQPGLILEKSGSLIGATMADGPHNGGTAYELTPAQGSWTLSTLFAFTGESVPGPWAALTQDADGNLYGTTQGDPSSDDWGTVFRLTKSGSGWRETVLHRFTGGNDGGVPYSTVVFDSSGNLYGTTNLGGANGFGVVFEITR
jgi:uncharacterized repeat protein (TIGR03803 family)